MSGGRRNSNIGSQSDTGDQVRASGAVPGHIGQLTTTGGASISSLNTIGSGLAYTLNDTIAAQQTHEQLNPSVSLNQRIKMVKRHGTFQVVGEYPAGQPMPGEFVYEVEVKLIQKAKVILE